MEMLNQFMSGNFNVAVPLPYVLTALGVLIGLYFAIRKVISVVLGLFSFMAKTNFALFASALMLITGLSGAGWSIGDLNSGTSNVAAIPGGMSNADLRNLVSQADSKDRPEAIRNITEYAKWRDSSVMSHGQYNTQDITKIDYRVPGSLLGGSLALVLCSVIVFIMKVQNM